LFISKGAVPNLNVNTLFSSEDVPGYTTMPYSKCGMCHSGMKLDALIGSEGYMKI
jgi:hypothetical protein